MGPRNACFEFFVLCENNESQEITQFIKTCDQGRESTGFTFKTSICIHHFRSANHQILRRIPKNRQFGTKLPNVPRLTAQYHTNICSPRNSLRPWASSRAECRSYALSHMAVLYPHAWACAAAAAAATIYADLPGYDAICFVSHIACAPQVALGRARKLLGDYSMLRPMTAVAKSNKRWLFYNFRDTNISLAGDVKICRGFG